MKYLRFSPSSYQDIGNKNSKVRGKKRTSFLIVNDKIVTFLLKIDSFLEPKKFSIKKVLENFILFFSERMEFVLMDMTGWD